MNGLDKESIVALVLEIAIKLSVVAFIVYVSFLIVDPFIPIILWSSILAVTLFPPVEYLANKFQTTRKRVVTILAIVLNLLLIVPTYLVSDKAIASMKKLTAIAKNGSVTFPLPPHGMKQFPVIGEELYNFWLEASTNFEATFKSFEPQIKSIALHLLNLFGDALSVVVISVVSMIVAAFLVIHADTLSHFYTHISTRLIGNKGREWARLTALTIRSVALGVIGVGVIQGAFALLGLVVMKIPFSIVIALSIMFLTIVQLPAFIVIGPLLAYVLSHDTSTSAIVFSIYMLIVGGIDGVLKPLLMGRGVNLPMLVVLVGAIGGMLLMGMIGLFVGAVIFSLAYKLFILWLDYK